MPESLWEGEGGWGNTDIGGKKVGKSVASQCGGEMAWAGGVSEESGITAGLFKSDDASVDGLNLGAVAGAGAFAIGGGGYAKGDKDFDGGGSGGISGSKLLFAVVSETDGVSADQVAQVVAGQLYNMCESITCKAIFH